MKVLTLWQPWASLVAVGAKTIETRSWSTSYRGELAIHAAQRQATPAEYRTVQEAMPLSSRSVFGEPLPRGAVIATCTLHDIVPTERVMQWEGPTWLWARDVAGFPRLCVSEVEAKLGDYTPERYAWILRDVVKVPRPLPAKGRQQLWDWDPMEAIV